jgi:hypothetical protein
VDLFFLVGFETADRITMDQVVQSLQSLSVDTEDSLSKLEDILKYKFKSKSLLKEAITHSSNNNTESYEKLEFVGDSVLGYLVTKHLYCTYPKLYQGTLTLLRSRNVDTEKFARVCVKHKFHQYLLLNAPALQQIVSYCKCHFKLAITKLILSDHEDE